MPKVCVYHAADLDGWCSAAVVKRFVPDCELVPMNYGDSFPLDYAKEFCQTMYMVDFSLQPFDEMAKVRDALGRSFIYIDHHKSALEDPRAEGFDGLRRIGTGACALAWEYFTKEPIPELVRLLAEYDVWDHHDPRAVPLQYGIKSMDNIRPSSKEGIARWQKLIDGDPPVDGLVMVGQKILTYVTQRNEDYTKAASFETEFEGMKCLAVNAMLAGSELLSSRWNDKMYDAMILFGWRGGSWTVSLYTTRKDVDVSVVAKKYMGGGHVGASGFQCSMLPFKLK